MWHIRIFSACVSECVALACPFWQTLVHTWGRYTAGSCLSSASESILASFAGSPYRRAQWSHHLYPNPAYSASGHRQTSPHRGQEGLLEDLLREESCLRKIPLSGWQNQWKPPHHLSLLFHLLPQYVLPAKPPCPNRSWWQTPPCRPRSDNQIDTSPPRYHSLPASPHTHPCPLCHQFLANSLHRYWRIQLPDNQVGTFKCTSVLSLASTSLER